MKQINTLSSLTDDCGAAVRDSSELDEACIRYSLYCDRNTAI